MTRRSVTANVAPRQARAFAKIQATPHATSMTAITSITIAAVAATPSPPSGDSQPVTRPATMIAAAIPDARTAWIQWRRAVITTDSPASRGGRELIAPPQHSITLRASPPREVSLYL